MRIVGIIAEYNPFHNGHLYQLQQARQLTQAEAAVVVLSGDFLQRGEPALTDKWLRTKMALQGGADLVLELPAAYAIRSAAAYATAAIGILAATGVVTDFCCACETPDLPALTAAAAAAAAESTGMQADLKLQLKAGKSFAAARSAALKQPEILKRPNNILAIEYLQAIAKQQAAGITLRPWLVQRIGSGHDQPLADTSSVEQQLADSAEQQTIGPAKLQTVGPAKLQTVGPAEQQNVGPAKLQTVGPAEKQFASASAIRQLLLCNPDDARLVQLLPAFSLELLQEYRHSGHKLASRELLFPFVQYQLLKQTPHSLAQILEVSEGLENKILQAVLTARSYEELVGNIKSKRYSWVRIQRILLNQLLNYSQQQALVFDRHNGPQYLRVLGVSPTGRLLLRKMREQATLPLLSRPARCQGQPAVLQQMLQLDLLAADLYQLICSTGQTGAGRQTNYDANNKKGQLFGQEYLRHPVITEDS